MPIPNATAPGLLRRDSLALVLLVAACSGGGSGSGVELKTTVRDQCTRVATALCTHAVGCRQASNLTECVKASVAGCCGQQGSCDRAPLSSEDAIHDCLAAANTADCSPADAAAPPPDAAPPVSDGGVSSANLNQPAACVGVIAWGTDGGVTPPRDGGGGAPKDMTGAATHTVSEFCTSIEQAFCSRYVTECMGPDTVSNCTNTGIPICCNGDCARISTTDPASVATCLSDIAAATCASLQSIQLPPSCRMVVR